MKKKFNYFLDLLKSPIVFGKNLGNHNFCNVREYHNTILKELKPVLIENIFRNGKNSVDVKNSIQKLLEENVESNSKTVENTKTNKKLNRNNLNQIQNSNVDFTYPFKQDNISCLIF